MNREQAIRLVRRLSGEEDVTWVEVIPAVAHHDGEEVTPSRMIRIGERFLVEMRECPGEWWMGEMQEGRLLVWGSYGSLEDAAAQH